MRSLDKFAWLLEVRIITSSDCADQISTTSGEYSEPDAVDPVRLEVCSFFEIPKNRSNGIQDADGWGLPRSISVCPSHAERGVIATRKAPDPGWRSGNLSSSAAAKRLRRLDALVSADIDSSSV